LPRGAGSGARGHDGRAADLSQSAGAADGSAADAAVPRRRRRRAPRGMIAGAIAANPRARPTGAERAAAQGSGETHASTSGVVWLRSIPTGSMGDECDVASGGRVI